MTREQFIIKASTWLQLRMAINTFQAKRIITELVGNFGEFEFSNEARPPRELMTFMSLLANRLMGLEAATRMGKNGVVKVEDCEDEKSPLHGYVLVPEVWWKGTLKMIDTGMARVAAEQKGNPLGQPNPDPSSESSCPIVKP